MKMKTLQTENGFTLIEALVAMVVLSIGIFSLYSMQLSGIRGNSKANTLTTAATWNADQVEQMIGVQYSDATVMKDTDGDGTNHDHDLNGIDERGDNFGLNDVQCCPNGKDPVGNVVTGCTKKADGCANQSGYSILWNVAVGEPMPNLKTVRVHVLDRANRLTKPVTFTYIKSQY